MRHSLLKKTIAIVVMSLLVLTTEGQVCLYSFADTIDANGEETTIMQVSDQSSAEAGDPAADDSDKQGKSAASTDKDADGDQAVTTKENESLPAEAGDPAPDGSDESGKSVVDANAVAGEDAVGQKGIILKNTNPGDTKNDEEPTYTIHYDSNGGEGTIPDTTFKKSELNKEKVTSPIDKFTRTGYYLKNNTGKAYNTKADNTGTAYGYGDYLSKIDFGDDTEITLYVYWNANSYSVMFHGNGGTYNGSDSYKQTGFTYDVKKPLQSNKFRKDSVTFAGWNTEPNGSGTSYSNQEWVMNLTAEKSGVVNLYAQWGKKITILGDSGTLKYNGKEQTISKFKDADADGFIPVDGGYVKPLFSIEGKGEDVGTYNVVKAGSDPTSTATVTVSNDEFELYDSNKNKIDNSDCILSYKPGKLTIERTTVDVNIKGNTDSVEYNGQPHTLSGYTVEVTSDPSNSYKTEYIKYNGEEPTITKTDVGKYPLGLKSEDFKNTNPNYSVNKSFTDGSLEITRASVKISIKGSKKTEKYNGQPHSLSGYTIKITEDPTNSFKEEYIQYSGSNPTISETDVGKYKLGLKIGDFKNTNKNYNATIEFTDGELKIEEKKVNVTITGNKDKVTYDGEEHSVKGYKFESDSDLYKESYLNFSGDDEVKGRDADTYKMAIKSGDFVNTNKNFSVDIEVTPGELIIDKKPVIVTITGNKDKVTYDGEEHSVKGYKFESDSDLYKESYLKFSGNDEVKGRDADTYKMAIKSGDFVNTNKNFSVDIEVTPGELIIDKKPVNVTITGNKDKVTYDGEEHSVKGYKFESDSDLYKESYLNFSGDDEVKGRDADTYKMAIKSGDFVNTNKNFSVDIEVTPGELIIDKKPVNVTITGNKDKVTYDGEEHSVKGYKFESDSDLYKEADLKFSGNDEVSGRDADTYKMAIKSGDFVNTNKNFSVDIEVTPGELIIDKKPVIVTITGNKDKVTYDGEEHSVKGYKFESDSDLYKESYLNFSGDDEVKGRDADTYKMEIASKDFANTNNNFTVNIEVTPGELKVLPKEVTVTAYNLSKIEDDPDPELTATVEGTLNGDKVEYTLSREKGETKGIYEITAAGNAEQGNYKVSFKGGLFTILAKEVTITYDLNGGTYNGSSESITETHEKGEDITAHEAPEKEGYTFDGWDPEVPSKMPGENITVTAKWTPIEYTITFDTKGGSKIDPITQDYGTDVTAPKDPTREGYTFDGWEPAVPKTMPSENMTLAAKWKVNQYKVTYKYLGEVPAGASELPADALYDFGSKVKVADPATASGYTFSGWSKEDFTMPAEDVEITGTFTAKGDTPYKVEHYKEMTEDGKYQLAETEDFTGKTGATATANPKTYEGFSLNTKAGGAVESGVIAADGSLVLKLFYDRDDCAITYSLNGGSYNGSTDDITEEHKYGEEIAIHEAPEREGYTFVEWRGSSYQPGDKYTVVADHTFEAIWEEAAAPDDDDEEEEEEAEEPEDTAKPDKAKDKGVNTGDETDLMAIGGIFGASLLGLLAMIRRRKREQQ